MEPLTVSATLDSLRLIGRYVTAAAAEAGLDSKAAYRLRLAVDEIATNIVVHGYSEAGRTGDVLVHVDIADQSVTVVLEDTAVPFDPRSMGRPSQIDLPIEDKPIGGLGVFLAIKSVDEFRYEYLGGRNRNVFVMKRPR